jgi:hypothetical protein
MCWFLLGVIMAWARIVYGEPVAKHPDSDVLKESSPDALPEIPPMFKRDKEAEATAKKADVYVRFMAE